MQVYYHFLFFISILNPSAVISESMKDVEKSNISINKGKNPDCCQFNFSITSNKITTSTIGKWHVGRVSRKQYEIINMLWRKTKIFIDTGTTKAFNNTFKEVKKHKRYKNSQHVTLVNHNPMQESFQLAHPKSNIYSSTSSYIEFYYLDELDERMKHNDNTVKSNNQAVTRSNVYEKIWKSGLSRSPFFLFRVNEATCKATTPDLLSHRFVQWSTPKASTRVDHQKKIRTLKSSRRDKIHENTKSVHNSQTNSIIISTLSVPTTYFKNRLLQQEIYKPSVKEFPDIINKCTTISKTTTAVNDHIRFFDIYDSYVPLTLIEDDGDKVNSNTIQNKKKINLNEVDHNAKYDDKNKTRYVKKHINQSKNHLRENYEYNNLVITNINLSSNTTPSIDNPSHFALWSNYPFVAVYVYEPTQVRCDSASISPHWLVASASCLNRHHKDIKVQGRSAFVAYCSGNWQHPERIAYVKQSLIHPRFHPKDNSRRHLYNIGAIQVLNSMADTCNGWAPITLMSHKFTAAIGGTLAIALGWGLDRYGKKNSLTELPKQLTLYKGLVYSDSCPGNIGYSNSRREDEGSVKNVYCLSLPPYTDEVNDPTHGSILLYGGKLIALYMQEERYKRGNQSAQYTSIWYLIPWLLDVAREPDELDPFSLEL